MQIACNVTVLPPYCRGTSASAQGHKDVCAVLPVGTSVDHRPPTAGIYELWFSLSGVLFGI